MAYKLHHKVSSQNDYIDNEETESGERDEE